MGPDAMILVFWMLSFKPTFWLPFFTFIKRLFIDMNQPWIYKNFLKEIKKKEEAL